MVTTATPTAPTGTQTAGLKPSAPSAVTKPAAQKHSLSDLMGQVINAKTKLRQKELDGRVNFLEANMVGGDAFNMGYLTFQGLLLAKPSLAAIPSLAMAGFLFGEIAGLINIGVAISCLKGAIKEHKAGRKAMALRLYIDFVALFLVGTIMILTSLAMKVAALGAVATFFAANPWLLPVLFLAVTGPTLLEVAARIKNRVMKKDLAALLPQSVNDLKKLVDGEDENNPFHLKPLENTLKQKGEDPDTVNAKVVVALSERMEKLQEGMGVDAAIAAFELLKAVLDNHEKEYDKKLAALKEKITEWNRAQNVRLFQQLLYVAAFGVSMGMLASPAMNTATFNSAQSFVMAGANAIPLYMDLKWPFKRNVHIVVGDAIKPLGENFPKLKELRPGHFNTSPS